jgi:cobalt-zinc-cadmium efflux system protein
MLTDVLSLGLAWLAARMAQRGPTSRRTYGFHRAGILAALVNAGTLIFIAGGITVEAMTRLRHPVPVVPWVMSAVAVVGLLGNLYIAFGLGHGHDHGEQANLNVRSVWLHVVGDAAASAGVLVAGLLVAWTHQSFWDPVLSVGIALLIARGAWQILRETINVLMEGTPSGVDFHKVVYALQSDPSVVSAHHVHIWSIDGTRAALSGHLVVRDASLSQVEMVIARVSDNLRKNFGISHATLQPESESSSCDSGDCDQAPGGPW